MLLKLQMIKKEFPRVLLDASGDSVKKISDNLFKGAKDLAAEHGNNFKLTDIIGVSPSLKKEVEGKWKKLEKIYKVST